MDRLFLDATNVPNTLRLFRHRRRALADDERGGVALITAVAMPALLALAGIGVEISNWTRIQSQLQRTADIAAIAGAAEYYIAGSAKNAAGAAADAAELNGAAGAGLLSRSWTSASNQLADGEATIQIVSGIKTSSNKAVKVTVKRNVTLAITRMLLGKASITASATGWAEALTSTEACVLGLSGNVSTQGNASMTLTGCSVASNANISAGGSSSMTARAFYAMGTISGNVSDSPSYPGHARTPDPYANNAPVQSALVTVITVKGPAYSFKKGDSPPTALVIYGDWDIKDNLQLDPGLYYVNGDITINGGGSLTGTGVTIVSSGDVKINGNASVNLSAPIKDATKGIPGMVLVGSSSSTVKLNGGSAVVLSGAVYYPKATVEFGGNANAGSSGCLKVVAASVTAKGNPTLASNCSDSYGTTTNIRTSSTTASLVQ